MFPRMSKPIYLNFHIHICKGVQHISFDKVAIESAFLE